MDQTIDLNKVPKQFGEKFILGMGKEHFVIGILCGPNLAPFAFTRSTTKELHKALGEALEKSESVFGKITLDSGIPSPIQIQEDGEKPQTKPKKS